jgi:hypothetical protein
MRKPNLQITGLSFDNLQSERSQFREGGFIIRLKNALDPQTFSNLNEHWRIIYIDYLVRMNPHDIERNTKNICIGFSQPDVAGRNKIIYELIQLELVNPKLIKLAPFIADNENLQTIL